MQAFAATPNGEELDRLRVRPRTRGRSSAWHWRGAPDEEAALAAVEGIAEQARRPGSSPTGGARCSRSARPCAIDKGGAVRRLLRDVDLDAALYAGDDTTDLDAFRGLTELVGVGPPQAAVARRRAVRRGTARDRRGGRRGGRRRRRRARPCSRRCSTTRPCDSPTSSGDRHDQRGRGDAAGRDDRARRRHAGLRPHGRVHLGRVVDRRNGDRLDARAPRRDQPADRPPARGRALPDHRCPSSTPAGR